MRRLLNNLPLIFLVCIVSGFVGAFYMSSTSHELAFRIGMYFTYAISVTVIALGYIALCRRSPDGKVAVWLATATYTSICFSVTMWGIVALILVRTYIPGREKAGEGDITVIEQLSYGFIAIGAIGDALAAIVLMVGFLTGILNYHIYPWIRIGGYISRSESTQGGTPGPPGPRGKEGVEGEEGPQGRTGRRGRTGRDA